VPDTFLGEPPEIWWPDDRTWIVVTEIDYAWTYVGAAGAVIAAILDHPDLEALPAKLTDRPFHDSDLLNTPAPPSGAPRGRRR
jgi:hypothetical protein